MSYIDRIRKIEYQLNKNLPFTPTDEQRVAMANSIIKSQLNLAEENEENITDTSLNPTSFLGASVIWDTSNPEGDGYTIELGSFSISQDADDPIGMIIDTSDGISDAEAVALDKSDLAIGLGTNSELSSVESDLTFPTSGSNGTTITWDASGVSSIDNSGVVTQPSGSDESGTITATITKNAESDTKTFNITVLQSALSGTEFITTWQTDATGTTTSGTNQVKLPLDSSGTYNFTVDWGDGTQDTITSYNQAEVTHTYSSAGSYDITIDGQCEGWGFWYSDEDNSKLTGIKQWGNIKLHNNGNQFFQCDNLSSYTAADVLDVSSLTSINNMFNGTTIPAGFDASSWNTLNITDMGSVFMNATLPAGFDISGWDTSNATNMYGIFNRATLPTGFDISDWDTSSVTDMSSIFYDTTLPTGLDISTWNTSSVTNMKWMFWNTTLPTGFDISGWDTSNATNMYGTFQYTVLPDGFDISGWDTSSATDMNYMFGDATLPDPFDLSGWCVTNIATEPAGFGTFNGATQLKPVWGTCPGSGFSVSGEISNVPTSGRTVKVYAYPTADGYDYINEMNNNFPNASYEVEAVLDVSTYNYDLTITQQDTYDILAVFWETTNPSSKTPIGQQELLVDQSLSGINFIYSTSPT